MAEDSFNFSGGVAALASSTEKSPWDVFDEMVQSSTRSITALANARNTVRGALASTQTVTGSTPQTSTASSGLPNWVLLAALGFVAWKVLK